MPTHTITFALPEESEELCMTQKAGDYYCALSELRNYVCYKYKHLDPPDESARKEYEELKEKFFEVLRDYEIDL